MIKSEHFDIRELVDPETFERHGQRSWLFLDPMLIETLDIIRSELKRAITVNDYMWGGERQWSGLRTKDSPWYSMYSQHTFGRAVDFLVKDMPANEVRSHIKRLFKQGKLPVKGLRMELGVSWVHIDVANVQGLVTFRP